MSDEDSQTGQGTAEQKGSGKKPTPWYKSIVWGPLIIAIIGALMQIMGTIVPISVGPTGYDFSISINPGIDNVIMDSKTGTTAISENIIITDLHRWIKPYQHPIYVRVIRQTIPPGIKIDLEKKLGHLPINIQMNVHIDNSSYVPGEYEIIVQGMGEDGLTRNSTYFLNLEEKSKTGNEDFRTYSGLYPAGVIYSGSEALYVDPTSGNSLTRIEYIAKYQIDPQVYWEERKNGFPSPKP